MIGTLPESVELVLLAEKPARVEFRLTDGAIAESVARIDSAIEWLRRG